MWTYNYSSNILAHHGILGQKWGIRRYQNPDGTLTKAGARRIQKERAKIEAKDLKWAKKNAEKITKEARKPYAQELADYTQELLSEPGAMTKDKKVSSATAMKYNRRMAELLNQSVKDLRSPGGKAVVFVAKRGEIGVHLALADVGYDMSQVKNGVYGNGKVAYRKNVIERK